MTNKIAKVGIVASILFLIILAALHFIEPEFDPSISLISVYELGKYGWMMSIAFFSLGVGVLSLVFSTWVSTKTKRSLIGNWLFLVIAAALFGAGIFYPYTTPNLASSIHTACGMIVIFTFPIAATLYSSGMNKCKEWKGSQNWLRLMSLLVWCGLLVFLGSLIFFHPADAKDKVNLVVGLQNRFMMITYSLWLIALNYKVAFKTDQDLKKI
jgi:hypothetical membrane protein